MNDLSRIVRLYEKIPRVLDKVLIHVVDEFKQVGYFTSLPIAICFWLTFI